MEGDQSGVEVRRRGRVYRFPKEHLTEKVKLTSEEVEGRIKENKSGEAVFMERQREMINVERRQ